jgi:TonB family protein
LKLSERTPHRLSLSISIALHVILFLFLPVHYVLKLNSRQAVIRVPVEILNIKTAPEPAPVIAEKPKVTEKKVVKEVKQKKVKAPEVVKTTPVTPPKPAPGDRERAEITGPINPIYPKTALNYEWEGETVVELTIDHEGNIIDKKIIKSSGHDILDQSFLYYLDSRKYKPKQEYGEKKKDTIRLSYEFKI